MLAPRSEVVDTAHSDPASVQATDDSDNLLDRFLDFTDGENDMVVNGGEPGLDVEIERMLEGDLTALMTGKGECVWGGCLEGFKMCFS